MKARGLSGYDGPLQHKCAVLDQLHGIQGISNILWLENESEQDIIVFEDLGPTLEDVFKSTRQKLPVNTVALLAEQLVSKLIAWRSYILKKSPDHVPSIYPFM